MTMNRLIPMTLEQVRPSRRSDRLWMPRPGGMRPFVARQALLDVVAGSLPGTVQALVGRLKRSVRGTDCHHLRRVIRELLAMLPPRFAKFLRESMIRAEHVLAQRERDEALARTAFEEAPEIDEGTAEAIVWFEGQMCPA